uniref:Chromosome 16 open reading frame 87 n=1 Tax=Nothobranchius rachovii TaxID=451742 RepID=A0A1A8QVA7_9TELE
MNVTGTPGPVCSSLQEATDCLRRKRTMSASRTKKVKMATKSCPECDQQIPVACKSCPCGFVFISRKLLNAKLNECPPPAIADKLDFKRRRTERIRRERIGSHLTCDMENRRRPRANSQSDTIRRGRGRPKTVGLKKQEEDKEKQEKEVDIYASLSDEKAFVFSVALAEINRKILGQRLIL